MAHLNDNNKINMNILASFDHIANKALHKSSNQKWWNIPNINGLKLQAHGEIRGPPNNMLLFSRPSISKAFYGFLNST